MRSDHTYERVDADYDFRGGINMLDDQLPPGTYRYALNMVVRAGNLETRPSVGRPYRMALPGFDDPFYFNEDNARDNEAGHTGFWFPWTFVGSGFIRLQGRGTMRFPGSAFTLQIVVSDGRVYAMDPGQVRVIPTIEFIEGESVIRLVPAGDWLVMIRPGKKPLKWDGSAAGFIYFTDAGATNRIPLGIDAVWNANRLWVLDTDGLTIQASDIFDIDSYDFVEQQFYADLTTGDTVQRLWPFHGDTMLLFGKRKITALVGINAPVNPSIGITLASLTSQQTVSTTVGLVAREAIVQHGESVSFLSFRGITTVARNAQDNVQGRDVPLSATIRPLIDTINWDRASGACAGYHDSYLLFAVPTQDQTTNSTILVYDLLAAGGNGAWVSVWNGDLLTPSVMYEVDERLFFIAHDGAVREFFTDDHFDSLDQAADTHLYEIGETIKIGNYRRWRTSGTGAWRIWRALTDHVTSAASPEVDSTNWVLVSDLTQLYAISSEAWLRWYDHGDPATPKHESRAEVVIEHQNPTVTLKKEIAELGNLSAEFSAITYDRTAYETENQAAWSATNPNVDFATNGREDYTVMIPAAGMTISGTTGIDINAYTAHSFRFIPRQIDNLRWSTRIYNTTGRVKIKRCVSKAQEGRFAMRNVE